MLSGTQTLLSQPSDDLQAAIQTLLSQPSDDLQAGMQKLLTTHFAELANIPCVEGSFKKVYTLPAGQLALACFREKGNKRALQNGQMLLSKEKKLLEHLQGFGLVTVSIHGDPFCINDQYALLMSWIPDATFIDVKDQEAACRKLASILLDISIPSGEGWVLKKSSIEQDMLKKIVSPTFSMDALKMKALFLKQQFSRISKILIESQCLIADLQFLVNSSGVYIIDPIDVVTISPKSNSANMFEYLSVVDQSQQTNPDFIKLLYDGKRMLQQCLTFCESIESISSLDALEKMFLGCIQSKEALLPRWQTLSKMILTKNLPMPSTAITIPPRKRIPFVVLNKSNADIAISAHILSTSPEKKCRSDIKENDPESPTKLLTFQLGAALLNAPRVTIRRLFTETEDARIEDSKTIQERDFKHLNYK